MRLLQRVGAVLPGRRPVAAPQAPAPAGSAWQAFEAAEPAPEPEAEAPEDAPAAPEPVPEPEPEPAPAPPELPDLMALLPPELRQPAVRPAQPAPAAPAGLAVLDAIDEALLDFLAASPQAPLHPFAIHPADVTPAEDAPATAEVSPPSDEPAALAPEAEPDDEPAAEPAPQPAAPAPKPAARGFSAFLSDGLRHLDAPPPAKRSTPAPRSRPAALPPAAQPEPATEPTPAPTAFALPANPSLAAAAEIAGLIGVTLVDGDSGLLLAAEGRGLDHDAVAALGSQVVRTEQDAIAALGLDDAIEDILVTMTRRIHVLRPLQGMPQVFLFLALDRKVANLGMARMQLGRIEASLLAGGRR